MTSSSSAPRRPGRLSPKRKVALAQSQDKVWDLFRGANDGRGINVSRTPPQLHCPLCFTMTAFDELTEEHAPPQTLPADLSRRLRSR